MHPMTRLISRALPRAGGLGLGCAGGAGAGAAFRASPSSKFASTPFFTTSASSAPSFPSSSASYSNVGFSARGAFQRQSRRAYSSEPDPPKQPKNSGGIKFWPFVVIIGLGFGSFAMLTNRRVGTAPPTSGNMPALEQPKPAAGQIPAPAKPTPTFSPDDTTVIFVLGGPGAGKGTQCANLVENHSFTHLSAGDLLRAEQSRPGSQFGQLIRDYIKDGLIVPMEVTVQLLENAMADAIRQSQATGGAAAKHNKFLIDGFPRKMDQAVKFEESVCPARLVLFYDCPEEEMERRLLERGKTSGRADDNAESIRKRFRTFVDTSMPVVDAFEKQGKVVKIDATTTPDVVYAKTKSELQKRLGDKF